MPNLLELPSLTRYRLFMAMGGGLLLVAGIAQLLTADDSNSLTRFTAATAMLSYALFATKLRWVRRNHHLVVVMVLLPLLAHMVVMTYLSNLAYDMVISHVVILSLVCAIVDHRFWLNVLVVMWCTVLITTAWMVSTPVMSPMTYTILMIILAAVIGTLVLHFHEAQQQLKLKINELNESQAFARVGTWEVDLRTQVVTWSKATYDMLHMQPGDAIPKFQEMLTQSESNRDFITAIRRFFDGEDSYDAIGQMVTGNGDSIWAHARGTTFYEDGQPVRKFGVFLDVTEHIEREQALEEAKQAAEAAAEARTQFLANMSHEIRTPMNGVIGMASLLEQEPLSETTKKYVEVIQGCSDSLMATINDILDFTKLDAGKVILEQRVFSVGKVVQNSVDVVRKSIEDKGLALHVTGDAHELELIGDPLRLEQVLVNLLSNAAKFTKNGSITVHAERGDIHGYKQGVKLQVIDTGIGIAKKAQQGLFTPFTQADASTTREYGGTGLGLAISYKLVTQMQGDLQLESTPGQGSTFTVDVALPRASQMLDTKAPQEEAHMSDGLQILLAEDNKVNQTVAIRMLQKLGVEPTVVENGVEALDAMQANQFDLVLMDLQMPQMGGLEATERIRAMDDIQQPKIIALTANAMQEDRKRCIDVGMDDFLAKPVRLEDLRAAITASV